MMTPRCSSSTGLRYKDTPSQAWLITHTHAVSRTSHVLWCHPFQTVMNNLNPVWETFRVSLNSLCSGDHECKLQVHTWLIPSVWPDEKTMMTSLCVFVLSVHSVGLGLQWETWLHRRVWGHVQGDERSHWWTTGGPSVCFSHWFSHMPNGRNPCRLARVVAGLILSCGVCTFSPCMGSLWVLCLPPLWG